MATAVDVDATVDQFGFTKNLPSGHETKKGDNEGDVIVSFILSYQDTFSMARISLFFSANP